MKKTKPKRLDVFTDQKRAEAEARRKVESAMFMASLAKVKKK